MGPSPLTAEPIRIAFILLSNSREPMPSTRIAVMNMLPHLRAANFQPEILYEPEQATEMPDVLHLDPGALAARYRIVYFQKVYGPSVESLARRLSAAGVKTVFGVCDRVVESMARVTDMTITVTDYLKSLYPADLHDRIRVVHDGIENPQALKHRAPPADERRGALRAVLVTSAHLTHLPVIQTPPAWLNVTIVGSYPDPAERAHRLREIRWSLARQTTTERLAFVRFLSDRRIRCVPWSADGVYEHLRSADVGIIPIEAEAESLSEPNPPLWRVKSENRLTLKMSIGLAVVATPIPAYEAVIEQGVNGFLARTKRDWETYLGALRDPELRHSIGENARRSVEQRFSMERQARLLVDALHALLGQHCGDSGAQTRSA